MDIAKESGALFYSPPEAMDKFVDPLIRPICEWINKSGWVWTAESCQGHPDAVDGAWADNNAPMLRLVTREADHGRMLAALMKAYTTLDSAKRTGAAILQLRGIRIYPNSRPNDGWSEVLVYLDAANVYQRNCALKVWEEFSRICNESVP